MESQNKYPTSDKAPIANDRGPLYYKSNIEPWDFIIANSLGFLEGNIIKYVSRYKGKNGLEDLNKAKHYLEKLIEIEKFKVQGKSIFVGKRSENEI